MLLLAPGSPSADPKDLAMAKNCLSCHKIEGKRIGPAYCDVARKYARDEDGKAKIIRQIEDGGIIRATPLDALPQPIVATVSGFPTAEVWRQVTMPPQPQVSLDEAARLADWILSLAR